MSRSTGSVAMCFIMGIALLATVAATTQNVLPDIGTPATVVSARNADNNLLGLCPNMVRHVFEGAIPRDEGKAGKFEEYKPANEGIDIDDEVNLRSCLAACCEKGRNNTCNVVFVFKRKCYHVRCISNEACLPNARSAVKERLQMILVNPVRQHGTNDENVTWLDVIKDSKSGVDLLPLEVESGNGNSLSFWKQPHKFRYPIKNQVEPATYEDDGFPLAEKRMKQLLMSTVDDDNIAPDDLAFYNANVAPDLSVDGKFIACDLELAELGSRCPPKEECVALHLTATTGVCKCVAGYRRNHLHECVAENAYYQFVEESNPRHLTMVAAGTQDVPVLEPKMYSSEEHDSSAREKYNKNLVISVQSKEVRLPEKEVTLETFTVPAEQPTDNYKYLWTLVTQPKGPMNGTISDQSKSKVKLSNLSEGLYTFKVSVTGANGTYGTAMANVTVLPEKRTNRVPQVVITPKEQIIRQPTTNAVLDGSASSDDDKIINWHWEIVSGPIGYQPILADVTTLQLTDLNMPGNYTFKLTVTDSDNVTNSTIANITVLTPTDYPPVANAGEAVILYLPNNNVTLNGTASSDDHEIVAWEWTKDASDETKAVDMQNTRTPYVQLSNLEEGMYTFVLKVTDGSGQSSSAKVHVFVKPPTNSPPVANAGANTTVNLPQNWALLNGSLSTDDIRIISYNWKQLSGPNVAKLMPANESITNATALTLGLYEFEITVMDDNNNSVSDTTWVKVIQERNAVPIANAGGDFSVTLPISAIYLNGSKSWDDLGIVKYSWTREDASLAAGVVVGNSDKEPVLILSNIAHGRYVYKLTVSDKQGLTSEDVVSVTVHPDPMLLYLVQLTLPMSISLLTQAELNTIVQKIGLLLGDMKVHIRQLEYDTRTEQTILVFYVEAMGSNGLSPVNGLITERLLKHKLQRDATILGTVFTDVRTTVCQNKCSDHGACNIVTRACICEAFWMPTIAYFWGFDEANCDWSILYVFVCIIVSFLLLSGMFWGIVCVCRRNQRIKKPRSRPKEQKYSLIGTQDEEAPNIGRSTTLSDSDTDSDVLFETRTKPNGIMRSNGSAKNKHHGHNQKQYAITKLSRKIKT